MVEHWFLKNSPYWTFLADGVTNIEVGAEFGVEDIGWLKACFQPNPAHAFASSLVHSHVEVHVLANPDPGPL